MGITNVNEIVKSKSSRAFISVRVGNLKNKRIAIDAALWMHSNMAVAQREKVRYMKNLFEEIDRGELLKYCISTAIKFCCYLLDRDIYPVWIEDGESPHEKKETRAKRKKIKDDRKEKIEELKKILSKQDILCRDPVMIDELRKLMMYDVKFSPDENKMVYRVLRGMGIPVVVAPGEAEAYACSLNREGIVYGIWTTDTDCYALGGINMITGMGSPDSEGFETFEVVHIPYIRKDLGFSEEEMRDFCIMCGTDFNLNIPNVGSKRAYEAIEKYRSIEGYIENENEKGEKSKKYKSKDISILNHDRSRELLTTPKCDLDINRDELNLNREKFLESSQDLSVQFDLENFCNKITYHLNRDIDITKYDISTGPHNKKKKISLMINGQLVKSNKITSVPKEPKILKYDKSVTSMEGLMKNLSILE